MQTNFPSSSVAKVITEVVALSVASLAAKP